MEIVRNCSTCGHMKLKGIFVLTEYCEMARQSCEQARKYPSSSGCGTDRGAWVQGNTVTVSFENYKKMKAWEALGE